MSILPTAPLYPLHLFYWPSDDPTFPDVDIPRQNFQIFDPLVTKEQSITASLDLVPERFLCDGLDGVTQNMEQAGLVVTLYTLIREMFKSW